MSQPSVLCDWQANVGLQVRCSLLLFRVCQKIQASHKLLRLLGFPLLALYKVVVIWFFHFDIPVATQIGQRLRIFHGYNLVINPNAKIGSDVVLRHGVTIGNKVSGGPAPTIEDGVQVGANAIILGDILVGKGAQIGAGAVVVKDVPSNAIAVGNPARYIQPK